MTVLWPGQSDPIRLRIRAALRANEIGGGDPYRLSYAGAGNSGPSFGIFQGDLAAKNSAVRNTMWLVLVGAGMSPSIANGMIGALSEPCTASPLNPDAAAQIDAALASPGGRALVDQMDDTILDAVLSEVGTSIATAIAAGRALEDGAAIAIALWSNMTGLPSTLNRWLAGQIVQEKGGVAPTPSGPTTTLGDVIAYLALADFFVAHQRNLAHFKQSVAAGLASEPVGS
jgi:hypothetical protein